MSSTLKIKEALAEAGIEAVETEIVKNGVICSGFRIETESDLKPVIYYSQEETIDSFVSRALEAKNKQTPMFDVNELLQRDNILKNAYLCVQKKSNEDIAKKELLNLELYVRVEVNNIESELGTLATIKLTPQILEEVDISLEELFKIATDNSLEKVSVCSIVELLGLQNEFASDMQMYVATYDDNNHGAGILGLNKVFHGFCMEHDVETCLIIPSSINELILLPGSTYSKANIVTMIEEVNSTQVDPILQLDAVLYEYSLSNDEVAIAASYKEVL